MKDMRMTILQQRLVNKNIIHVSFAKLFLHLRGLLPLTYDLTSRFKRNVNVK